MVEKELDLTWSSAISCPKKLRLIACQSIKIDPCLKCNHCQHKEHETPSCVDDKHCDQIGATDCLEKLILETSYDV